MATKYKRFKVKGHFVCRIATGKKKGKFAPLTKCGLKPAGSRLKKRRATKKRKTKRKTIKKMYFRDAGGRCRKKGKRGFAREANCTRAKV